ncbi:hypothetical protein Dsin_013193 [Dipteronia sinensis]|uniref:Reverse transcriptase domain-containing protein n=1 Tax=Dipteronia sinensis TaxID=43782 RepID=A0AAE0AJI0_9ROSI|nr:hypothetical protein Dsin_013193 [Dipteronia sinensis]
MGFCTKHNMKTRNSKIQNSGEVQRLSGIFEEEVTKILETEAALGFDFNGVEKELVEAITIREEEEDDIRYNEMKSSTLLPWCLGGDFNTILEPSKRKGLGCNMGSIRNFNSFVLKANVVNLPLIEDKDMMKEVVKEWKGCKVSSSKSVALASKIKKSWVKWLKEGDKNSKFFHSVANGRSRRNHIGEISFGGVKVSNPVQVRNGVVNFFKDQFSNVGWRRPKILGLEIKLILEVERKVLDEGFSEEEVWGAVSGCDGNKAPGPDDLNLNFIKANWKVIQGDFMKFIHEFHKDGSIVKDLNKTFVALIPKCSHPETMKDFRPISLVGSMYKLLAKVLANRLKVVMNSVIEEYQMAFVKDRQILDSFVVAEEIIHS